MAHRRHESARQHGAATDPFRTIILRTIVLGQSVTDEQGEKLPHIAKICPVARLLEGEIVIDTVLDGDALSEATEGIQCSQ